MGRVWFEPGDENETAFVFSCPGQKELEQGHPAAGATGRNLDSLIEVLHGWGVPIATRQEALITNAWPGVEYDRSSSEDSQENEDSDNSEGSQGAKVRTQADRHEIVSPWNLDRLASELANVNRWVIGFGERAEWAIAELHHQRRLRPGCRYAVTSHPSPRNQNRNGQDVKLLTLAAARLAVQMGYGENVPAETMEFLRRPVQEQGLMLSAIRLLAEQVRGHLEVALPGFPNASDDSALLAAQTLAATIGHIGRTACVVTGVIKLRAGWPVSLRRKGATKTPPHSWVECDGWVFDLTRDRFTGCLDQAPPVFCKAVARAKDYQGAPEMPSALLVGGDVMHEAVAAAALEHLTPLLRRLGFEDELRNE